MEIDCQGFERHDEYYQASQDQSIIMANLSNIINTEKKVPLNVGVKKKGEEVEISSLFIMVENIFSRPKSCTEKTFFKGSCKFDFMKKLSVISNISCKKQSNLLLHLWLVAVIQGQYLLLLRINSVAINKDLGKLPGVSTVVLDEDENLL